ncbi:MAG TPA: amino acid adenylation domain-containing protein [Archangium sp.]|nr:amino acid adenylation domain-containing protein [Archangium sp.]
MMSAKLAEEFWRGRWVGVVGERFFQSGPGELAGARQEYVVEGEPALAARLEQVSAGSPTGRFLLLAAALRVLLLRYTGRLDTLIAAPAQGGGLRFLKAAPGAGGQARVGELLASLAAEVAELEGRALVEVEPFLEKFRALKWGEPEALLQLGLEEGAGAGSSPMERTRLLFRVERRGDGLLLRMRYDANLRERALVPQLGRHFLSALRAVLRGPEQRLAGIEWLETSERETLLRGLFEAPRPVPAEASLPSLAELVERRARLSPERTALLYHDERVSYRELDERANALAHQVRGWLGSGREEIVALVMDRSVEMIVSVLAVLKAGAAYLPLDPSFPEERLGFMLRDSGSRLLLANRDPAGLGFVPDGCRVVDVRTLGALRAPAPPQRERSGQDLALVIYTSGSTGEPKGVLLQHDSLVYKIVVTAVDLGFDETLRIPLLGAFSFDSSVYQTFVTLWAGGALLLLDDEEKNDPRVLWQRLSRHEINTINCVPPFLAAVLAEPGCVRPVPLRTVILGGDRVPASLVNRSRAMLGFERFVNLYGPTETAIDVIRHVSTEETIEDPVPIGRPQPGTPVYILDESLAPVPVGVVGEIFIGGPGVGRGYLRREALTAERFLADPFSPGGRMYRTGDLGRWRPDGEIEFLGRRDGQLKVRGNRVELGELEKALARHPGVQEAIASVREGVGGEPELVAHYVGPRELELGALRQYLKGLLPDFMVPARLIWLARWPLTPSGKVDRERLPEQSSRRTVVPPRTELERGLLPLWQAVLGTEEAGITDDFFELGGHSLKLVRLLSAVYERLGLEVGFREIFQHPTVESLAAALAGRQGQRVVQLQRTPDAPSYPVSYGQRRIFMLSQLEPQAHLAYNMAEGYRLDGPLQLPLLRRALEALAERHESLRTVFAVIDGEPRQVVRASLSPAFEVIEHTAALVAERDGLVLKALAADAQTPFDLEKGPLIRLTVLRFSADDHALVVATHHIISDGWSSAVICRELMELYAAAVRGEAAALAPLPIQYRDYVAWQDAYLESTLAETHRRYWLERLAPPVPVLPLRTDFPRPEQRSFRSGARTFSVPDTLLSGLRALCREEGLTTFMALLALVDVLLARHAGTDEVLVAVPVAGRSRAELEPQVGFYVNTLILRGHVEPAESLRSLLQRVRGTTLEAYQHQDYPFDRIVEESRVERALGRHPFTDVVVEMLIDDPLSGWSRPPPARSPGTWSPPMT